MKLSVVHTNEGRLFQMVGAQHENRRAAMFVDEECVDSIGLTQMTSGHATVYMVRVQK